jgi:hypothetical protein
MLHDSRHTFATAVSGVKTGTVGDAVQVVTADTPCRMIHIHAKAGNASNVSIGDSSADASTGQGKLLANGEHYDYPLNNLNKVYLDILTAGDGIDYIYFRD